MEKTQKQYNDVINVCSLIFEQKMQDYGTAWRILRTSSLTDQIYIKAQRIRSIEEKGFSKIDDSIENEFIGIINYSIMALIQLEKGIANIEKNLKFDKEVLNLYFQKFNTSKLLMENKNHDYDEAWRNMRISSLTDIILMKILRIKQIEDNQGKTLISEGLEANYTDIINYSVFALVKILETKNNNN